LTSPPTQVVVQAPVVVLQVLVCVPQVPHVPAGALPPQLHVVSHWQSLLHDCEPPPSGPQPRVAPGAHAPVPPHVLVHVPVFGSHVPDKVPQLPHEPDGAGPVQPHAVGHWQSMPHVCEPLPSEPHARVAPGAQLPVLVQVLTQVPVFVSHMLANVPQFPHEPEGGLPVHAHALGHLQSVPQVCMPALPHDCILPGAHAPLLLHVVVHAPVLVSQVADSVPQLPHEPEGGLPVHAHALGHLQSMPQFCMPEVPQLCIEPGAQAPSPVHAP
jgi:hypothetical protein